MRETQEDIERLQTLIDKSIERAGAFLRRSFQMPEHSLSATDLVQELHAVQQVALATVTAKGEPRVAPIDSVFYRGSFYLPTVATAARTKHIMKRPAVSLVRFIENKLAIIVHGYATIVMPDHPDFETLEGILHTYHGTSVSNWGEGMYLYVNAEALYTYVRYPNSQSGGSSAVQVRPLAVEDSEWVQQFIIDRWGDSVVIAHGTIYHPLMLPGLVATLRDERVGLLTYSITGDSGEIVTIDSTKPDIGVGTALIEAARQAIIAAHCKRLWLITTNDNLNALRFYQKRGFTLVAVHRNAVEAARQRKPQISLIGNDGIPLRDEIELEMML